MQMTKKIIKYDFKTGLPQEFEILNLTELYSKSRNILTKLHRSGFYHIIWFDDCNVTHLVDFVPVKVKPHSLLFLNKDVVHRFDEREQIKGKVLLFTDSFFCRTENDTKYLRQNILFNDLLHVTQLEIQTQSSVFNSLLQLMTEEIQTTSDEFQAGILQNFLHNFLLHSEREKRKQNFTILKQGSDLDYVLLFKEFSEIDFKTQRQVGYYAKKIIVTEKRLNQATSKIWGKSPKQIIDDRLLLEAKRILAHTTDSVKEVAFQLGFDEPTNFIKYFKKHTTQTPIEFRKKYSPE
jgi:AraC family transcriptional regulator, transcriptional activator of pobA